MKYLLLVILGFPALSHSADWVYLAESAGVSTSIDIQSIELLKGGIRKGWIKYLYDEPQTDEAGKKYSQVMDQTFYACAERKVVTARQMLYGSAQEGRLVGDVIVEQKDLRFTDVIPDSVGESAYEFICAFKPKRK